MTTTDTTAATGDAAAAAAAGSASGASAGSTTPAANTATPDAAAAAAAVTLAAQTAETARIAAAAKPAELALKLPDNAALSPADLETVKAFAKANGLSQDAAQKALEQTNGILASRLQADQKAFSDMVAAWPAEIKADKEIGGEHFDQTMRLRDKVLASFGSEKLVKGLTDSGLINDPEIVRLLARVGKASSEDTLRGRGVAAQGQTREAAQKAQLAARYPKMQPA